MPAIEPTQYAKGGALDWHNAMSYRDLPQIIPSGDVPRATDHNEIKFAAGLDTEMFISPYHWANATNGISTEYSKERITVFEWLMFEAARLEGRGCKCVIIRRGMSICLFRSMTKNEVYPITERNVHEWRESLTARRPLVAE